MKHPPLDCGALERHTLAELRADAALASCLAAQYGIDERDLAATCNEQAALAPRRSGTAHE